MQDSLFNALGELGQWIHPHLDDLALALVATVLVIYGDDINKSVKRAVGKKNMILRFSAFIALCAFGYGALTVFAARLLKRIFLEVPQQYMILVVVGSFVVLAVLAERKNQV